MKTCAEKVIRKHQVLKQLKLSRLTLLLLKTFKLEVHVEDCYYLLDDSNVLLLSVNILLLAYKPGSF